jgi:UDP-N-acetylmuramoylalanine--D-glutamate ligase
MKANQGIFRFTSYKFDPKNRKVFFNYEINSAEGKSLRFTETLFFPKTFSLVNIPSQLLDNILLNLHLALGVSYYKLYCPPKIELAKKISKEQADFWNVVYEKGLGEFFYRNKINFKGLVNFPYSENMKPAPQRLSRKKRALVGIGGGKDSIVAVEFLREQKFDMAAFSIETQGASSVVPELVQKMKIGSLTVERQLDKKIFDKHEGAFNGHVPISAIFAFLGYLTAVLYDYAYVVVANEFSSNFGNTKYLGETINHQWSKSAEFEDLFQNYTKKFISPDVVYFSALRPFYEIRIVEMFVKHKEYFPFFTSCNRSFRIHKERPEGLWCGECPKCVFMFIMLSAFLDKKELIKIFNKNLYEDKKLLPLFADVLGFGKMKPFDCVGTFDEAQVALFLAGKKFQNSLVVKTFLKKIKNPIKLKAKVFKTNNSLILPAPFKFLGIKNVLIFGYGKEGMVTEKYIKKFFPKIKVGIADKKYGADYLEKQSGFDLAIKTPGIPGRLVKIPYITGTNLFFSQIKNLTIGVTGSKGKSTTASLIYYILKEAGKKVTLLGNIGNPMLEVLTRPIDADEIFVLELSSYQLDDIRYSPNVSVVLNLFPEHMDYHGDIEKYYEAKKNIIKFQNPWDYFVYNGQDAKLKEWASGSVAKKALFSKSINLKNTKALLVGKHNEDNIRAAIAVVHILKIPEKNIINAIKKFKPLPHRLEFVREFKGIKFYDDAISTTPESTIAAIKALKNVGTIFLGGLDRGYDFSQLVAVIDRSKIKNIVFFPDSGKKIEKTLRKKSKKDYMILHTRNMKEAVKFAFKNTKIGRICLLSTASPSYSLWKNFEEKGDKFKEAVKGLK